MSDTEKLILIETRISNEGKSIVVAYMFWFFLGYFSAHRFYMGNRFAILQLILNILIVGLIWTLIDVFLIPGMIRKSQGELRARLQAEIG